MNVRMNPPPRQQPSVTAVEPGVEPVVTSSCSSDRVLVWKTAGEKPYFASLRYRCLLQLPYLKARGWESLVLFKGETVRDWSRVTALIIVKSCRGNDLALAREAAAARVPVVFDLTDNLFAEGYGGPNGDRMRGNFKALAKLCSAVTVASPAMVEAVRPHLPPDLPVRVVPDPVETEPDTRAAFSCRHWRRDTLGLRSSSRRRKIKRFGRDLADLFRGECRALRYKLPPPATPARTPGRKRVVWFGKFDKHSLSGLVALSDIIPALERVDRYHPLELLVVSNSRRKFESHIAGASFPTHYREWHPLGVYDCIRSADAVVIPNRSNAFSLPKSANRAVFALTLGVPVVATPSPALADLTDAIYPDDWETSLPRALVDSADRQRRLNLGRTLVAALFGGAAIATAWDDTLRSVLGERPSRSDPQPETPARDLADDQRSLEGEGLRVATQA